MANEATILRIRAQVENLEGLNRARSAVRNFATESKAASNDLDLLRSLFKQLGDESVRSVNNLKNYRTGLDALRQSAQIGSKTFNELTSEIKQLDIELGSLQGKQAQVASGPCYRWPPVPKDENAAFFDTLACGAKFCWRLMISRRSSWSSTRTPGYCPRGRRESPPRWPALR